MIRRVLLEGAGSLDHVRLAANLVIVFASATIARSLYRLGRNPLKKAQPPGARVLLLFAALIALCGVSHLAVVLADTSPAQAVPTILKVASSALWVVAALRCGPVVAGLMSPLPCLCQCSSTSNDESLPSINDLMTVKIERLKIKARMLDNMIRDDLWILDKTDALKELREILADLEAYQCPT